MMLLKLDNKHLISSILVLVATFVASYEAATAPESSARRHSNLAPKLKSQQQQPPLDKARASSVGATQSNLNERSVNQNGPTNSRLESSSFVEDELPADFYEMPAEQLDLGMNATGRAPVPILNVAVLQNGQMIDKDATVHPGTPLEMVVYLDDKSAKVYGLLTTFLKVQDDTAKQREEVIVLNGCSIDTYIFGNFEHNPEDQSLRAKFRAFKFPESNFVRFVGTVNVCIKQCPRVNCVGSRRKRAASNPNSNAKDERERLVMTVSTVLRIAEPVGDHKRLIAG